MTRRRIVRPLDILLPYQRKWVLDNARFKMGLWGRQEGKSFSTACETVLDCQLNPKTDWVVLSTGERQAIEWLEKAKKWTQAFDLSLVGTEFQRIGGEETLLKQAEIQYPNGSRIICVPANPKTVRGYSANILLDEFSHHERPRVIWKAIFPSISNQLTGIKKVRIISTANGKSGKFYELWQKQNRYSKHKVTIHDASRMGLPVDLDELRESVDDDETWAQEYLCEFLATSSVLLPYELIAQCESADCCDGYFNITEARNHFIGVDVGRKKDLTVVWILEELPDGSLRTVDVLEWKNMPFNVQLQNISQLMQDHPTIRHGFVDATGIGAMLAEELHRVYGYRVEEFVFNNLSKNTILLDMQRAFEANTVRVPISRVVREDLHSIRKVTTIAGNIAYRAPSNEDGHADRAIALALALNAYNEYNAGSCEVKRVTSDIRSPDEIMESAFGAYGGITL